MPRSGPIAAALNKALRSAPRAASDAAGVALAKRYAALLDDAAPARKYGKALATLRSVMHRWGDDEREAFEVLAAALGAHSVTSDLGPKLDRLLTALELTPAGRRRARAEGSDDEPAPAAASTSTVPGADELERLRRNRARRQQHS